MDSVPRLCYFQRVEAATDTGTGSLARRVAPAILLLVALAIAWPILTDGHTTYLDNPPHVAEVYELAEGRKWSDLAFAGFPLAPLHSPLWYGVLTLFARSGIPVAPVYGIFVWLGFLAPALALYYVLKSRVGVWPALALALILLGQRTSMVGLGASLGGMWTFYIACGAFLVYADRLARPAARARDIAIVAAIVAFIFLTHLFMVVPMVVLTALHIARRINQTRSLPRELLFQLAGCALGIVCACVYWAPHALTVGAMKLHSQDLAPPQVLARLLVSSEVLDLLTKQLPPMTLARLLQSLPMLALAALGVAGGLQLHRRSDDLPFYGFTLAIAMFVLVAFVGPFVKYTVLGHVSWRMIYFVRLGLIMSAAPFVVMMLARLPALGRATGGAAIASVAAAMALWVGVEVHRTVPRLDSPEVAEVRELWQWIEDNHNDRSRVYVQDTFMCPPLKRELARSHILALTSHETGARQLGAWYGAVPFPTVEWTPGEFGMLFRGFVNTDDRITRLLSLTQLSNSLLVVVTYPELADYLKKSDRLRVVHTIGRFTIFRPVNQTANWTDHRGASARHEEDRIEIELTSAAPRGELVVKTAYHPFWHLDGPDGVALAPTGAGLMHITGLTRPAALTLDYRPPRWPLLATLAGFVALGALFWRFRS